MSGMIVLEPGRDWSASGGLFEWVVLYVAAHVSDPVLRSDLGEVVSEDLGMVWLPGMSVSAQEEFAAVVRGGLVAAARADLPDTEFKEQAVEQVSHLVDLFDA